MIESTTVSAPIRGPVRRATRAKATKSGAMLCGTLLLDGDGRIQGCGTAGAQVLGGDEARLIGRPIERFIAGLDIKDNFLSDYSGYLDYLCATGAWRTFEAESLLGHRFTVELSLSRVRTGAEEALIVNLRTGRNLSLV